MSAEGRLEAAGVVLDEKQYKPYTPPPLSADCISLPPGI